MTEFSSDTVTTGDFLRALIKSFSHPDTVILSLEMEILFFWLIFLSEVRICKLATLFSLYSVQRFMITRLRSLFIKGCVYRDGWYDRNIIITIHHHFYETQYVWWHTGLLKNKRQWNNSVRFNTGSNKLNDLTLEKKEIAIDH